MCGIWESTIEEGGGRGEGWEVGGYTPIEKDVYDNN